MVSAIALPRPSLNRSGQCLRNDVIVPHASKHAAQKRPSLHDFISPGLNKAEQTEPGASFPFLNVSEVNSACRTLTGTSVTHLRFVIANVETSVYAAHSVRY